jgi:hypothetical protein
MRLMLNGFGAITATDPLYAQRKLAITPILPLLQWTDVIPPSDPRTGRDLYRAQHIALIARHPALFKSMSLEDFSELVRQVASAYGFKPLPCTPDQWLADWGGSLDPEAQAIAAHVGWYYAKRGLLDGDQNFFTNHLGQRIDSKYIDAAFWFNTRRVRGDRLRQPLLGEDNGLPVKVKDLPWFIEFYISWAKQGVMFRSPERLATTDVPNGSNGAIPFGKDHTAGGEGGLWLDGGVVIRSGVMQAAVEGWEVKDTAIASAAISIASGLVTSIAASGGTLTMVAAIGAVIAWYAFAASQIVQWAENKDRARGVAQKKKVVWDQNFEAAFACAQAGGEFTVERGCNRSAAQIAQAQAENQQQPAPPVQPTWQLPPQSQPQPQPVPARRSSWLIPTLFLGGIAGLALWFRSRRP